ncbi:hypothetical protein [Tessaracoccus sp. G1721]
MLVKHPPPLSVRLSQLLWAFSFVVGAVGIVYFFIVREDQLPLIAASIKAVDGTRSEETYSSAADIVFWSFFGIMVTLVLIQITLLVSFMSRRDGIRWWQLGTLIVQGLVFALMTEMVGGGEHATSLRQVLLGQCGLVLLALVSSVFPGAIKWTARHHDVRRGTVASGGGEL